MGCCASGPEGGDPEKKNGVPLQSLARENMQSFRESFRLSQTRKSRLYTEWGAESHEVRSRYRQRRLSDQSMSLIMDDPTIYEAFQSFVKQDANEVVVSCWKEMDEFCTYIAGSNADKQVIVDGAQTLCDKYILGEFTEKFSTILARSTIDDLIFDLCIDKEDLKHKICQTNIQTIENVFKVIHLRMHNFLKYEYLPGFLVSEEFRKLTALGENASSSEEEEEEEDEEDEFVTTEVDEHSVSLETMTPSSVNSISSIEETSSIVTDDEIAPFFFEYVFMEAKSLDENLGKHLARRKSSLQRALDRNRSHSLQRHLNLVELFLELEALLESTDEETRLRRLNLILNRYGQPSQTLIQPPVQSLYALNERLHDDMQRNKPLTSLPQDVNEQIGEVKSDVIAMIGRRLVPGFKRSNTYRRMVSGDRKLLQYPSSTLTVKIDENEPLRLRASSSPKREGTAAHVAALESYIQESKMPSRTFSASKGDQGLDDVLANSHGIFLLKRHARRLFQEENVSFLVNVQQFKRNVGISKRDDMYELLHSAQSICNQFIEPGSPLEVNISAKQRSTTLELFNECSSEFYEGLKPDCHEGDDNADFALNKVSRSLIKKTGKIFNETELEIYRLVQKGLWESFKEDKAYEDFQSKLVHNRFRKRTS
eukprot:CAMPEP_0203757278 /NCGR_PEP_ID=MMETSP0098-20131031/10402_1 /ASSEMBLY_ACC=CAM_ASM_000208 /TAXON_ID=96639 /ORGANISM=" , Strain NY0313808BC1" /LENGTH=652 /DNA_ID=CAMNT_0050649469 /DNA_START=1735 /DNA_END=3689 /DNA_ORIENTATION=+